MLVAAARVRSAAAVPCADYTSAEHDLRRILRYESSASLPHAYEHLADVWACLHEKATPAEFIRWVHELPTNASADSGLQAVAIERNRVLVIWARNDIPDGGHAALYGWSSGAMKLVDTAALEMTPVLVATLGRRHVVIREENRIPRYTTSALRVLTTTDDGIVQTHFEPDFVHPRVLRKQSRRLVLGFERLPRGFSTWDDGPRLRYQVTLTASDHGVDIAKKPLTPALDVLEQHCARPSSSGSRVASDSLSGRLPRCSSLSVRDVRAVGRASYHVEFEAPMVCHDAAGNMLPVGDAVLIIVRPKDASYRMERLTRKGCAVVRARGADEAL